MPSPRNVLFRELEQLHTQILGQAWQLRWDKGAKHCREGPAERMGGKVPGKTPCPASNMAAGEQGDLERALDLRQSHQETEPDTFALLKTALLGQR